MLHQTALQVPVQCLATPVAVSSDEHVRWGPFREFNKWVGQLLEALDRICEHEWLSLNTHLKKSEITISFVCPVVFLFSYSLWSNRNAVFEVLSSLGYRNSVTTLICNMIHLTMNSENCLYSCMNETFLALLTLFSCSSPASCFLVPLKIPKILFSTKQQTFYSHFLSEN